MASVLGVRTEDEGIKVGVDTDADEIVELDDTDGLDEGQTSDVDSIGEDDELEAEEDSDRGGADANVAKDDSAAIDDEDVDDNEVSQESIGSSFESCGGASDDDSKCATADELALLGAGEEDAVGSVVVKDDWDVDA
jgi:hypothetical protein